MSRRNTWHSGEHASLPAGMPPLEVVTTETAGASGTLRAATYGRVSSPKQRTVDSQIGLCRKRADERNWSVRYVLKDQGLQGDDIERPGFQRILDLADRGAIDVVIVWKIDRLARSLAHAVALEEHLRQRGVAIHSCTEPIDTTTPIGRFIFGNLANAAQLEKELIRERVQMGKYARAKEGRWTQSKVPFGYRKTKGHYLRVHPEEAEVVRRVFATYPDHPSYSETAAALNEARVTYGGRRWTTQRVRQTLENEIYRGLFRASGVEKEISKLAIVSKGEFERVRNLRAEAVRDGQPASTRARERSIDAIFEQYLASLRDEP